MDSRKAIRPDHRWAAPIQLGAGRAGSLPYITNADSSWKTASRAAPEASHTFTVSGLEKPAMFTAMPVGSCTLPSTPRVTDTAAPIASGPSSFATSPGGDGNGRAGESVLIRHSLRVRIRY